MPGPAARGAACSHGPTESETVTQCHRRRRANLNAAGGPRSEVTVSRVRVGPARGSKLLSWRKVNRVSSSRTGPAGRIRGSLSHPSPDSEAAVPPITPILGRPFGPVGHVAADSDDARSSPGRPGCDGPVPGLSSEPAAARARVTSHLDGHESRSRSLTSLVNAGSIASFGGFHGLECMGFEMVGGCVCVANLNTSDPQMSH